MEHKFCPGCGRDLEKQERFVERGPWKLAIDHTQVHGDWLRHITPQQAAFLYTLGLAQGDHFVPAQAMGERIARDPNIENFRTVASVVAFKLRKALGADVPFESHQHWGYRWKVAA